MANVLIYSRRMDIDHFQKNCPQRDQVIYKTCGEKRFDSKDHTCSGITKYIHCGEAHRSNESKVRIVTEYRAALTRTLFADPAAQHTETFSYQNFPSNRSKPN